MRHLAALLVIVLASAVPPAAWSASQQALGLDDLIDTADEIVVGTVAESSARWEGRLVVTTSVVEVEESLKGGAGRRIEITQLGGTAVHPVIGKPVTINASSFTALAPGERVVLFVDHRRPAVRQLVGAQQGKLAVRPDPSGTPSVAVGPKRLAGRTDGARATITTEAMSLDELRRHVRARLGGKTP
jgi:hypothetical protein